MNARIHVGMGASLLLCFATSAVAQTPPEGNLDERVRQQLQLPRDRERAEAQMTGDSDLVLLRRTQLFNLHGSLDLSTTSNAYLAPEDGISDQYGQAQVGIGFATRVAGKVDVFADLAMVSVRYLNEDSLDYGAATGSLGASIDVGLFKVGATYQPSMVFDRDFAHRQLTSHRVRVSASLPFQLGTVSVQPDVHVERAMTNPSAYKAWTGGVAVTVSEPLSQRIPLLAYVNAGYDYRVFDDYFEAFVGTQRKDDSINAGAGVVWRLAAFGEVRASYSFGHNGSTSDVNRYNSHSGVLGVSAALRF